MASTDKTNLGLNQWVLSDKPSMEDFNEDNRIVDEALHNIDNEFESTRETVGVFDTRLDNLEAQIQNLTGMLGEISTITEFAGRLSAAEQQLSTLTGAAGRIARLEGMTATGRQDITLPLSGWQAFGEDTYRQAVSFLIGSATGAAWTPIATDPETHAVLPYPIYSMNDGAGIYVETKELPEGDVSIQVVCIPFEVV